MKRHARLIAPVLLLVALTACIPHTIVTPQGKAAYTAVQVLTRVDELQNATIAGNQQGVIPDKTAILLVKFCVTSAKTLKATPDGWQATIRAAWAATKANIPPPDAAKLQPYLDAVDLVLTSLIGG